MNGNTLQNSAHRDVLQAPIPDSESSQRGFLEELKNRGRSAVGGKAWPDAQMLYEKALQVVDVLGSATPNERAILHSNLSLVLAKMGKFSDAKAAAMKATEQDRSYVKGWWRLSQALASTKDYEPAVEAMEKALMLDPNNKALKKECDKLKEEAAKAPEEPVKETGPKTEPAPPRSEIYKAKEPGSSPSKPKTAVPAKTTQDVEMEDANPAPSNRSSTAAIDSDDKNLFTKSDAVRGYKIVNGKKTSYFHNELSEEAKQLIGDIAPKKLDASAQPVTTQPSSGETSVWNKAGTWEERDVTAWAKETLKEALQKTTYTFPDSSPAPGATARISAVKKVDGHASFATVRSKKKYIYEFALQLEWALDLSNETDAAQGKIQFPDIDGTIELGEGYDSTFEITAVEDQSLRPVLDRFVKNQGLRESLHQAIDDWVRAFREKY